MRGYILLDSSRNGEGVLGSAGSLVHLIVVFGRFGVHSGGTRFVQVVRRRRTRSTVTFTLSLVAGATTFTTHGKTGVTSLCTLKRASTTGCVGRGCVGSGTLTGTTFFQANFLSPVNIMGSF